MSATPKGPQPQVDPSPRARGFRRDVLPKSARRADAHDVVNDAMHIIQRELQKFKGKLNMDLQDIRAVSELAKTAKEIRQLEALLEDEAAEELGKLSDEELAQKAGEGI